MIARPKLSPSVVVTLSKSEAEALVGALLRAIDPITAAGNMLDVSRLNTLRGGLEVALTGVTHREEVTR